MFGSGSAVGLVYRESDGKDAIALSVLDLVRQNREGGSPAVLQFRQSEQPLHGL